MKFGWATALLLLVCVACAPSGGSSAVASSPTPPVNQATLSPDLTTAMTQAADSILAAVNVRRALVGISPLIQQPILVDAAQERSVDMAALGYLAHVNPENGRLEAEQILRSRGFLGQVAELLFQSVSPIEDIPGATVAAWFDDDDHSLILLSPEFRYTGIGVMGDGDHWIVTMIMTGDVP